MRAVYKQYKDAEKRRAYLKHWRENNQDKIKDYRTRDVRARNKTREKIRERDNYTCQICHRQWIGGRRFPVHHLDCDRTKSTITENYEEAKDNLITLCHKCHINLHWSNVAFF